ncbi:protein DDI1 homolog 2-like isoform 1-T1 [Anomaloglossus baeobatrachus]|uniref:protein DDI1 homolog 2-like isoform X1 n=1 Tax=Anomaloglossus baeobatrachus TaxID=238106 RepID=UPI003F50255F
MLITVYCVRRDLSEITFSLDVDQDFELENFRALCELESGVPAAESLIIYAEQPLTDNQRSLSSYGLKDGDVVVLRQKDPAESRSAAPRPAAAFSGLPRIDFSSIAVPGTSRPPAASPQPRPPAPDSTSFPQGLDNPALLKEMLLANPHELSLLKERNPPLAEALLSGDLEKFTKVLVEQQQERARREQERIRLFSADPFDLEAQAKIEEDIRQQNIEENMTIAMEEAPESFGQVVMLYINCKVNGYPVKAFVDSGAQMTIMSQACAERCHIMRLVDRRWAGIAKGVGTQKIIGRVHLAQVQIEGDFLPCSFSILEEQPMDMLLGLDMLKRHQCSIDLEKNVLVIGTTGTRTSFLPEGELPECARLAYGPGTEDIRPEDIADRELAEVLQKSADEADRESTSEAGPSLVPPLDGSTHPGHSLDTIIPAAPVPAPSSAADFAGSAGHTGDTSESFRSAVTDDLSGAASPPASAADRGPGPSPISTAAVSSEWGPHLRDALPPSTSSPVEDGGAETPAPAAIAEDLMDTHVIVDDCGSGGIVSIRGPGSHHPSCTNLSPNPERSEDLLSATKKDCPKPPASSGPEGEDGCFSLASALKELHELVVISGQGSPLSGGEEGALCPGADPGAFNQESDQNGDKDTDLYGGKGPGVTVCNMADTPGAAPGDCTVPVGTSGSELDHQVVTGALCHSGAAAAGDGPLPGLSSEGVVCARSPPSVHPTALPAVVEHAVERIVGAGFTRQDAIVALERADGDVEMALLALLAKNIVVPT